MVSTRGNAYVREPGGGWLSVRDEDLIVLGKNGRFERYFDGSDVRLGREDTSGAWLDPATNQLYGTTTAAFSVAGLTGGKDDIFRFTGTTGPRTSGTFDLFFDGGPSGFAGENIDALHVTLAEAEVNTEPVAADNLGITSKDSVLQIGPSLTVMSAFGKGRGAAIGQFAVPGGLAVDADGNIVVAEPFNGRIQTCDPTGTTCTTFSAWDGEPNSVTVEPDGMLLISDAEMSRFHRCTPTGSSYTTMGESGDEPGQFNEASITDVTADGRLLIDDYRRVQICDPNVTSCAVLFDFEAWVKVDPAGNLVVSTRDGMQTCDADGDSCRPFGDLADTGGLVLFDEKDRAVVRTPAVWEAGVKVRAGVLHRCEADGTNCTTLGSIGTEPGQFDEGSLATDSTGNIVVSGGYTHRIQTLAFGLLDNDSDPDGDDLRVTAADAVSAHGAAVTVDPDGSYRYDPTRSAVIQALGADEVLTDIFAYTISDGNGGTATGAVTVKVTGSARCCE